MMSSSDINAAVCGSLGCRSSTGLMRVEVGDRGVRVLCSKCREEANR